MIDVDSCEISNYNPRFNNQINFNYFIKELMKYHFDFKLLISYKMFKKETKDINSVLKYIYNDNNNSILLAPLRNLGYTFNNLKKDTFNNTEHNLELDILKDPVVSIDYIIYLSNKYLMLSPYLNQKLFRDHFPSCPYLDSAIFSLLN